jgi:hypothetical protein
MNISAYLISLTQLIGARLPSPTTQSIIPRRFNFQAYVLNNQTEIVSRRNIRSTPILCQHALCRSLVQLIANPRLELCTLAA